jgi:hypothetical protein
MPIISTSRKIVNGNISGSSDSVDLKKAIEMMASFRK